jgi:hypothetical protein
MTRCAHCAGAMIVEVDRIETASWDVAMKCLCCGRQEPSAERHRGAGDSTQPAVRSGGRSNRLGRPANH